MDSIRKHNLTWVLSGEKPSFRFFYVVRYCQYKMFKARQEIFSDEVLWLIYFVELWFSYWFPTFPISSGNAFNMLPTGAKSNCNCERIVRAHFLDVRTASNDFKTCISAASLRIHMESVQEVHTNLSLVINFLQFSTSNCYVLELRCNSFPYLFSLY